MAGLSDFGQRVAPPPATPVQLPLASPREDLSRTGLTAENIYELFLTIHKTGPTPLHLKALGVSSITETTLDELLPNAHLPPVSWKQHPGATGGSTTFLSSSPVATLSNGYCKPGHDVYFARAKELLYENEEAYRTIRREPCPPDRPLVRLAHFRKFWDALSQMAGYWDTSQDQFNSSAAGEDRGAMELDQPGSQTKTASYTGHRIAAGKDMPFVYREDAVFAFVEGVAMAFRCKVEKPRSEAKVKLHNLLIPLQQTANVYRYPRDNMQARRGILEGPILGIHCTHQMVFRRPEEVQGQGQGELANFLRELGLMLSIAEKRSREGQTEPTPGESEWWLTKPRWGGAPDVAEIGIAEDAPKEAELRLPDAQVDPSNGGEPSSGRVGTERASRRQEPGSTSGDSEGAARGRKRTKRSNAIECWMNLQPSQSSWDKNIHYKKIGWDQQDTHDNVCTISTHI